MPRWQVVASRLVLPVGVVWLSGFGVSIAVGKVNDPRIQVSADGAAYVIWTPTSGGGVRSSVLPSGGKRWQNVSLPEKVRPYAQSGLTFDTAGSGLAVWGDTYWGGVYAATRPRGSVSWSLTEALVRRGETWAGADLVVAANGAAAAWWIDVDSAARVAYRPAGASRFGAPRTLARGGVIDLQVALDARGDATAAWLSRSGKNRHVSITSTSAGRWNAPVTLEASVEEPREIALSVAPNGGAILAVGSTGHLRALVRDPDRAIFRPDWSQKWRPGRVDAQLTASRSNDGAIVVWQGAGRTIRARQTQRTGPWSATTMLGTGSRPLTSFAGRSPVVAWYPALGQRGARARIAFSEVWGDVISVPGEVATVDIWRWGILALTPGPAGATLWWQTDDWQQRKLSSALISDANVRRQPDLPVA